ncbi:MAG: O-antigen ligase family protein [Polyangiales bacterium]
MGTAAATFRSLHLVEPEARPPRVTVAPPPRRWRGAALLASLVVAAALNPLLPAMMASTGRAGTEFIALALAPLFALAASGGVGAWSRPVMRPMVAVAGILALSLAVGEHLKDGAVKLFVTLSGLAWAAALVGERGRLARVAAWGAPLTLALWAASAVTRDALPRPSHMLALAVLYARLILDEEDRPRHLRPGEILVDVGLVGVIFLSTFRAATLAAGAALVAAAARSRRARWVLLLCGLCAAPALLVSTDREPTYSAAVARDDWQGRYGSLGEDRLSGRADIWENVWRDVQRSPAWLLTGHGAGDVDLYVARVNPTYHAHLRGDERAVHTHNTALELFLSAGIWGLIPAAWLVLMAASRARALGAQVGCSAGVLVVSMSNVPTLDWTGGTLLMAVWLYALAATEGARSIDPGARFAHGPAPRSHHDPPRTDPALPGREALS